MRTLAGVLLMFVCACAFAQLHHDPLTNLEVDQLRDTAQEPERRIELLLGFAHARLLGASQLQIGTKSSRQEIAKAEELLGDFALLIDELYDNLDMLDQRGEDLRTSLRRVLDAEAGFQRDLQGLAEQIAQVRSREPAAVGLTTALADATDSLQSSSESTGGMLASEERKRGEAKREKKSDPAQ